MRSIDTTHIGMLCCANWAAHIHLEHKISIPSGTYNTTITYWRQIIGTTCNKRRFVSTQIVQNNYFVIVINIWQRMGFNVIYDFIKKSPETEMICIVHC